MTTLAASTSGRDRRPRSPLMLGRQHWLAALAILFVLFAPYQTLVQTVITDDAIRLGIEADEYDMIWVNVAYGVGVHLRPVRGHVAVGPDRQAVYAGPGGARAFPPATCSAARATGLVSLAFGRFVEGFGKMMAMAVGRATLYKQFDRALLVAIGFYGVFAYSTRHWTPLVKAYLDVYLSWRWMYWAYVPIGLDRDGAGLALHPPRPAAAADARCRSTGWPSRPSWPGSWRSCSPSPGTASGAAGRRTRSSRRSSSASSCRWLWSPGWGRA